MTKYFRYLIVFGLNFATTYAPASNAVAPSLHVGIYEGTSPNWAKKKSTCQVTVSINKKDEFIVSLQDSLGTDFVRRSKENPSVFESVRLAVWSYPAIKLNQLLRNGKITEDGFSHSIRTATFSDESSWYLSADNLKRDGSGWIEIVYRKNKRWNTYNTILEYVPDHTGCYNLSRVQ